MKANHRCKTTTVLTEPPIRAQTYRKRSIGQQKLRVFVTEPHSKPLTSRDSGATPHQGTRALLTGFLTSHLRVQSLLQPVRYPSILLEISNCTKFFHRQLARRTITHQGAIISHYTIASVATNSVSCSCRPPPLDLSNHRLFVVDVLFIAIVKVNIP